MKDGDMWIEPLGNDYRIGYRYRGHGRFIVLKPEQIEQLTKLLLELKK